MNAVSLNNETALARAVGVNQYDAVKQLLNAGADRNLKLSGENVLTISPCVNTIARSRGY